MTLEELKKFEPIWDKWRVKELIGEGSYGAVYRIRSQQYGRSYESALKVISIPKDRAELYEISLSCETEQDTIDYYVRKRGDIEKEIDLQEQLKGKTNIVSIEDHNIIPHNNGMDAGYDIFIRMELLESFNHIRSSEARTWTDNREIVRMGLDVAEGLRVCHRHGIVHRDVKPGNIFRSKDGDYKIGDFGISRFASDRQMTMSVKGTPDYMAPEIYHYQPCDFRVDIYSLGMVMYHLLNKNRGPFLPLTNISTVQEQEKALMRRMKGDALPAPVLAKAALAEVVLKACSFEKEQRYSNMEEFKAALLALKAEDLERPDAQEAGLSETEEENQRQADGLDGEADDRTVAFVDPPTLPKEESGGTESQPVEKPVEDRKVVPDVKENGNTALPDRRRVLLLAGAGAATLIAICLIVAVLLPGSGESEKPANLQTAEDNRDDAEGLEQKEPEEDLQDIPAGPTQKEETPAPAAPYCAKQVSVISTENEGRLIFEGDPSETLKIKGAFQVSEEDETEVPGSLTIENLPEIIEKSDDYEWKFTPDDTEHYETVTGVVHVTAVHYDWVEGIDAVLAVEDRASLYQVDLTGCGLSDLSILEGAGNLAVLDISDNDISDISVLAGCRHLQQIYISNNAHLKDISPLFGLKKIKIYDLSGTNVPEKAIKKLEKIIAD